jgi:hypothetical protein
LWNEKRYKLRWVIAFDESAMLLARGKLWRVNPMSARDMKQGLRAI